MTEHTPLTDEQTKIEPLSVTATEYLRQLCSHALDGLEVIPEAWVPWVHRALATVDARDAEIARLRAERDAVLALTTNRGVGEACTDFLDDKRAEHYDFSARCNGYVTAIMAVRKALNITDSYAGHYPTEGRTER